MSENSRRMERVNNAEFIENIARLVKCLPSYFVGDNDHVVLAVKELVAENERLKKQADSAYCYAKKLFSSLAPQCEPLPDLIGLLTQLDNWSVGAKQSLNWISVKERLPEVKTDVLVFDEGNKLVYHAQMLCDNKFYDCENQCEVFYITHWADITLPKEEK